MLKNYFKLLRFEEWVPRFLILIGGYIMAKNISFSHAPLMLIAFISYLSLGSFGFIINDYFDREVDKKKEEKRNPISNNLVSETTAIALVLIAGFLGLFLPFILLPRVFPFFLISFIFIVAYHVPPLRAKDRPFLDIFINAATLAPIFFVVGYAMISDITLPILLIAATLLILDTIIGILQEIRDYNADKKAGLSTTVIILGIDRSMTLARLTALSAVLLYSIAVYFYLPLYFFLLLISLTPLIKFIFFKDVVKEISSNKLNDIANKSHLILISILIIIIPFWIGVIK